jgi:hypothetical protein
MTIKADDASSAAWSLLCQSMAGGEVVAVAEDGPKRRRDRTGRGFAADEVLVDAKPFRAPCKHRAQVVSAWL